MVRSKSWLSNTLNLTSNPDVGYQNPLEKYMSRHDDAWEPKWEKKTFHFNHMIHIDKIWHVFSWDGKQKSRINHIVFVRWKSIKIAKSSFHIGAQNKMESNQIKWTKYETLTGEVSNGIYFVCNLYGNKSYDNCIRSCVHWLKCVRFP